MTDTPKPLKIISLQAENIKRIVAVRIDPKGNLVHLTGKNGSGKTSTLDSIWWALAGLRNVQKAPIRTGQETARIKVDMGELIATRTFTRLEDGSFSSTIAVESADGARATKPQDLLNSLLGSLTFDPLAFANSEPKEQFNTLKQFVPGVDFAKLDGLNLADKEKRTTINRQAKEAATRAAAIAIPEATPKERIDETAIVQEIADVGEFNAEIDRRAERRIATANEAAALRASARGDKERCDALLKEIQTIRDAGGAKEVKADELDEKLRTAEPLPEKKDPAAIRTRLDEAKKTNAAVEQSTRREALQLEAAELEKQADALTERMAAREEEKRAAIAAAKLPVEGITFGEGEILLNGVPFDQASDAERLRTSVAIAMASNPRLRVIRVRDGSLLDEDGLRLIAEMADARDFQVWVESVDSSGKVGFVIEDGLVRAAPEPTAQAAE